MTKNMNACYPNLTFLLSKYVFIKKWLAWENITSFDVYQCAFLCEGGSENFSFYVTAISLTLWVSVYSLFIFSNQLLEKVKN